MKSYKYLLASTLILMPQVLSAAPPVTIFGADYVEAVTPTVFDGDLKNFPKIKLWEPGDPIKEIPKRRKTPRGPLPDAPPVPRLDPLLSAQQKTRSAVPDQAFSSTILDFQGQNFTGANPPDTNGDVGINYYVQLVNGAGSSIMVYNKSDGTIAAGPINLDSLGTGNCANGLGDPIVLFDSLANRWLLSEFSATANRLCVYISQTSDPTGSYFNYEFTTPNFPDYPKYSVWINGYIVTSNEPESAIYALDRSSMLAGSPASMQRFSVPGLSGFGFNALTPADVDGTNPPPANSPAYMMRHRDDEAHNVGANDPGKDFLELWALEVDYDTPANSSLTGPTSIDIAEFDSDLCGLVSFNCFPQPGSATTLDPLREIIMWRLQYRNNGEYETLVGNFATDVNGLDRGGIRWFELRKTGGGWTLHQEGTYSPDSINRWMGSIAMDKKGNIALAYNLVSSSVFPGIRYTGRLSSDPLGALPQGEHTLVTGLAANSSNRYGDYSAMSLDPVDDCTFWFTGEYNTAISWSTRISSFKFDSCDTSESLCFPVKTDAGKMTRICL